MDTTFITIISSFVFLILLWVVVGVRHLKVSKKTIDSSWEFVDERIRKRHDFAPVLVECIRVSASSGELEKIVGKMIPLRDSARRIYFPSLEKSEKETALTGILNELIANGEKSEAVKDTYFLEVKKEILDANKDILNRSRGYNEVVEKYNKSLKNVFLRPLTFALKLRNAEGFNF